MREPLALVVAARAQALPRQRNRNKRRRPVRAGEQRSHRDRQVVGDARQSLALLDEWEADLNACYHGTPRHPVFVALAQTVRQFEIPQQEFADLGLALSPAVQTPTLFQLLDENNDGRLGVRELRTAWSRLLPLEPVPPGETAEVVTRAAIQPSVSIRVSRFLDRATAQRPVNFVAGNPNQVRIPQKGPLWFRKMDRNGDGDVSPREWLGRTEDYGRIDADGDGLLSPEEAEQADSTFRK